MRLAMPDDAALSRADLADVAEGVDVAGTGNHHELARPGRVVERAVDRRLARRSCRGRRPSTARPCRGRCSARGTVLGGIDAAGQRDPRLHVGAATGEVGRLVAAGRVADREQPAVSILPASGPDAFWALHRLHGEVAPPASRRCVGAGGVTQQDLEAPLEVVGRDDDEAPRGQVRGEERRLEAVAEEPVAEEHQGTGRRRRRAGRGRPWW